MMIINILTTISTNICCIMFPEFSNSGFFYRKEDFDSPLISSDGWKNIQWQRCRTKCVAN